MGKLLRVSVVLLLLLGIAAFSLGYILFGKRETLKGHVTDLAGQVTELAKSIEAEQSTDLTHTGNPTMGGKVTADQLLTYKLPEGTVPDTNRLVTMDQTMKDLIGKAAVQLSILNDTRAALAQKIQDFDTATNKIAELEGKITQLEADKKALQDNIVTLEKDVAERKAKIEELNASLEESKAKVDELKETVAKQKEDIQDKDAKLKQSDDIIKRLNEQLKGNTAGGNSSNKVETIQGTKGKILMVNKEYNFVVIGLSNVQGVGTGVELTIQRGDKLVGKLRIADFNNQFQVAVGDVLQAPWKQMEPEVGDNVFY